MTAHLLGLASFLFGAALAAGIILAGIAASGYRQVVFG